MSRGRAAGAATADDGWPTGADDGAPTPPGWPFFAPSPDDAVGRALDLAGLAPGEHLVDLGCGEGEVLVAAARRGARVTGVECDEELAATAEQALAGAGRGGQGRVLVGDLFEPDLWGGPASPPDVLFAYLSPATLQRLTPELRRLRGTRLVTVDFEVPDLIVDASAATSTPHGSVRLYRLPGRLRRPRRARVGWSTAGTLCIMAPEVSSLTCLDAVHPGGPVRARLDGDLPAHAEIAVGCDTVTRGRPVAVDLRWRPQPPGTLAHGTVRVSGLPPHPLTVLFAEEEQGQWELSEDGCATLDDRLATDPPPTTARDLLDPLGC